MFDPSRKHHHHQHKSSFDLYDETRHETWELTNSNNLWPSKQPQLDMKINISDEDFRRTEAIIRGQKELMEIVRNMPESNYELSLKDLVEHHYRSREENYEEANEKTLTTMYGGNGKKKVELKRNRKIDRGGFYLKLGLPFFSFGSNDKEKKKKKKKESKVSPKPSNCNGLVKEKEWWKKSSSSVVYKESDESGASSIDSNGSIKSSTSSSSSSSGSRRIRTSSIRQGKSRVFCWPLFCKPKSQTKK